MALVIPTRLRPGTDAAHAWHLPWAPSGGQAHRCFYGHWPARCAALNRHSCSSKPKGSPCRPRVSEVAKRRDTDGSPVWSLWIPTCLVPPAPRSSLLPACWSCNFSLSTPGSRSRMLSLFPPLPGFNPTVKAFVDAAHGLLLPALNRDGIQRVKFQCSYF